MLWRSIYLRYVAKRIAAPMAFAVTHNEPFVPNCVRNASEVFAMQIRSQTRRADWRHIGNARLRFALLRRVRGALLVLFHSFAHVFTCF